MSDSPATEIVRQHLIDPEICIRCNTCEETCPIDAITHDARNYVVDFDKCGSCRACVPVCPTGAIDNWFSVPRSRAYTLAEQFSWDQLPAELTSAQLAEAAGVAAALLPRGRRQCRGARRYRASTTDNRPPDQGGPPPFIRDPACTSRFPASASSI